MTRIGATLRRMWRSLLARVLVVAVLAATLLAAGPQHQARADVHKVCAQRGPGGVCVVWVEVDSSSPGSPGDDGAISIKCVWPRYGTVPCYYHGGWWSTKWECYMKLLNPQPPKGDNYPWYGKTTGAIYGCELYRMIRSLPGMIWSETAPEPPIDPEEMARLALARMHIPTPTTGRYPAARMADGRIYTVVRGHTWYWTDPATYRPRSVTVTLGPVRVTVTVSPVELQFRSGEGTVSCAGPGTQWNSGYGPWAASPSGCQFTYQHVHERVTATYAIPWRATWTSSVGPGGVLAAPTTTATATFTVAELQSIVVR